MSRQKQHKKHQQHQRIKALLDVLAVIVCVWLLPASLAMAASGSISVNVEVVDAVALNVDKPANDTDPGLKSGQIVTEFVAQTASSPFSDNTLDKADGEQQAGGNIGLPLGSSSENGIDDAVCSGIHIIMTATKL